LVTEWIILHVMAHTMKKSREHLSFTENRLSSFEQQAMCI